MRLAVLQRAMRVYPKGVDRECEVGRRVEKDVQVPGHKVTEL